MAIYFKIVVLALALSVRPNQAIVYDPTKGQYCWESCLEVLSELTWAGTPSITDDYYAGVCENTIYIQSLYCCAKAYCTKVQVRDGFHYFQDYCGQQGHSPQDIETINNFTRKDIENLPRVEKDATDQVNVTSIPSQAYFDVAFRTIVC